MLRKLLKWEIKSTARILLPLYLTLILFTIINRVLNPIKIINESAGFSLYTFFTLIAFISYMAIIVGIAAMTTLLMLQRFYKNLLQDEGYLMFTLPIATWKHTASKLVVATMWTVLSVIITFCSFMIMADTSNAWGEFIAQISLLRDTMGVSFIYLLPFVALLLVTTNIMMIYTAISIGHSFSKNKLIASFGMYGVIYLTNQLVMVVSILLLGYTLFSGFDIAPSALQAQTLLSLFGIYLTVFTAALFTVNNRFLKNRLNLE